MNVAVMGRSLRGRFSGVVRYTDELVRALAARDDVDLTVFVTRAADGLDDVAAIRSRAPFPTPNEYVRAMWEQAVVPIAVARLRPDVYHSPNYILPLALHCPTVVTIHDLAFMQRSLHRLRSHLYLSTLTNLSIRKATRIICVSEATRADLVQHFPSASDKTRVISEGVDGKFHRQSAAVVESFRRRYGLTRPYVLFVGTIEPRKNLVRLIQAFDIAVDRTGAPHELVLVGQRGWKDAAVWKAMEGSSHRERIRCLGYVPDEDLPAAYSASELMAYPSLTEGFGLPPVEAMACGAPVLTSRVSALPEVVGNAAVLVNPVVVAEIAAALQRLFIDRIELARLSAEGLTRSTAFRWERVAEQTLAVYEEAAA